MAPCTSSEYENSTELSEIVRNGLNVGMEVPMEVHGKLQWKFTRSFGGFLGPPGSPLTSGREELSEAMHEESSREADHSGLGWWDWRNPWGIRLLVEALQLEKQGFLAFFGSVLGFVRLSMT